MPQHIIYANDQINLQASELIKGCIAGDRQSQNLLYSRYAPVIFPVCLRFANNRQEAEEILQEGFLKAFKHLSQFKASGTFEGWLRKIMVNTALEVLRNKPKLHTVVSINRAAAVPAVFPDFDANLTVKELILIVQKLPVAYRTVFNLYVFEGLKHREIAVVLGISEGTSKSNLSDARRLLQRSLNSAQMKNQDGIRKYSK